MVMSHMRSMSGVLLLAAVLALSGCGYNDLQGLDEDTKAAWSEVINQYQRRADLIPNLVSTVKGYAAHEKDKMCIRDSVCTGLGHPGDTLGAGSC